MGADSDIDVRVAEARALATRLNAVLDVLAEAGVGCCSVVGPPPSWDMRSTGVAIDISRVSLVLEFKRPDQERR